MLPEDEEQALKNVLQLVASELKIDYDGDDLAIRLGWETDRGANNGRRARDWVNGKKPPRQFVDLLHMLSEAGLLTPKAMRAWAGESATAAGLVASGKRAGQRALTSARAEAPEVQPPSREETQ